MRKKQAFELFADYVPIYPKIKEYNFYRIHNEEFDIIQTLNDSPRCCVISNEKFTLSAYITSYKSDYSEMAILFDKFKTLLGLPYTGCAIITIQGKPHLAHYHRDTDVIIKKDEQFGYLRQRFKCTPIDLYIKRKDKIYSIERMCGYDKVDKRANRKKLDSNVHDRLDYYEKNQHKTRIKLDNMIELDYTMGEYKITEIHLSKFMRLLSE